MDGLNTPTGPSSHVSTQATDGFVVMNPSTTPVPQEYTVHNVPDEANYFLQPGFADQHESSHEIYQAQWSVKKQVPVGSDPICASGARTDSDGPIVPPSTDSDNFVCGNDLIEQVRYQPFRIMQVLELAQEPFATCFMDPSCIRDMPNHLLITPLGFYRALVEVMKNDDISDGAILEALVSRYGTIPQVIENEDVIYSEDMEPCVLDEDGKPFDVEYWQWLHERREFWNTIPGGREYKTVKNFD